MRKRKQPQVPEHVTKWQEIFRARVAEIAPGMIRAEAEKRLNEADALREAYPGAISESFHQQYKASMEQLVARQQGSIAEGHVFRELFADMEPMAMLAYLNTQAINPAWLVGFSNDEAARERYEQEARKERAATFHVMQRAGARANVVKADKTALKAVKAWCNDPVHRGRCSALSLADKIRRYLNSAKPSRRQAERLEAMLEGDRIK